MLNIAGTINVLDLRNGLTTNNKSFIEINRHIFSDILNKERENLLSDRRGIKSIEYENQNRIENFTDKTNTLNDTNKPYNRPKPTARNNKTSPNKTVQPKEHRDIDVDDTIENAEEEVIDKNMAALRSVLLMLENILGLENADSVDMEINTDQLRELDSLKEQLLPLSETANLLSDDSLKQNIETIIDTINKISDELLLHNNEQLAMFKPDEIADNLEGIRDSIQSVLNESNIIKPTNPQNPYVKDDFLNPEEERSMENEKMLINIDGTEKGISNNIKSANKFVSNNKEEPFKQSKEDSEVLFKEQIVVFQQAGDSQNIDLKVIKDQVIESKQFINEIAQKVGTFILKGKNEMCIRLIPEHLGKLSIKIGLNEGTLTGKIYAENYSVKEAIEANLDQLRDSLEEQGLNISSLEVHINDNTQNFENSLYQSAFTNRPKFKTDHIETDSNFITMEQNIEQTNPYLIASQIDSLV